MVMVPHVLLSGKYSHYHVNRPLAKKIDLVVCLAVSVMAAHAESTPSGFLGSD
jgi:hypothetical protein